MRLAMAMFGLALPLALGGCGLIDDYRRDVDYPVEKVSARLAAITDDPEAFFYGVPDHRVPGLGNWQVVDPGKSIDWYGSNGEELAFRIAVTLEPLDGDRRTRVHANITQYPVKRPGIFGPAPRFLLDGLMRTMLDQALAQVEPLPPARTLATRADVPIEPPEPQRQATIAPGRPMLPLER